MPRNPNAGHAGAIGNNPRCHKSDFTNGFLDCNHKMGPRRLGTKKRPCNCACHQLKKKAEKISAPEAETTVQETPEQIEATR